MQLSAPITPDADLTPMGPVRSRYCPRLGRYIEGWNNPYRVRRHRTAEPKPQAPWQERRIALIRELAKWGGSTAYASLRRSERRSSTGISGRDVRRLIAEGLAYRESSYPRTFLRLTERGWRLLPPTPRPPRPPRYRNPKQAQAAFEAETGSE